MTMMLKYYLGRVGVKGGVRKRKEISEVGRKCFDEVDVFKKKLMFK